MTQTAVSTTDIHTAEQASAPYISVVIPLYNEEESIPHLYEKLTEALEAYGKPYEVIIVDDGSTDGSYPLLRQIAEKDKRFKIVRLRRNFGQTAAFAAGFDHARGEVIITMDADLQNDPADIPKLMAKIEEGYDIVSGWRINRQDRFLDRKLPSMIANRLISNVTEVRLHDYGCSLKAYRAEVLREVRLYGELHRFIPALASQVGGAVTEVPVNHHPRRFGKSKYGISRTIRVILDLITVWFLGTYSTRPLHVFGTMGLVSAGIGVLLGLYLSFLKIVEGQNIGGRPLLLLAVLLVVVGVQLITMGLLAEMIIRTYHESQGKPIYVVREVLNADEA
ncbi:glycosyltransferase family 2 protein [Ardenticatena maritima]|uniref:glycosyltransferase family 2 protein n=3 Tax=Ardenticatena maritima TaxID=872965 RepID=UPI0009EC4F2B|nr:glycosyltransferase family 2 protein [Ardenticatena maritima]